MDAAGELAVVPSCFHGGSDSCFLGAPGATGSPSGAMSGQGRGVVFSCRPPPLRVTPRPAWLGRKPCTIPGPVGTLISRVSPNFKFCGWNFFLANDLSVLLSAESWGSRAHGQDPECWVDG